MGRVNDLQSTYKLELIWCVGSSIKFAETVKKGIFLLQRLEAGGEDPLLKVKKKRCSCLHWRLKNVTDTLLFMIDKEGGSTRLINA